MTYTLIGFVLGGIIGGLITGMLFGKEYKKEIDSLTKENDKLIKKLHDKKESEYDEREKEAEKADEKIGELKNLAEKYGYSKKEEPEDEDDDLEIDDPFDDDDLDLSGDNIKVISKAVFDEDLKYRNYEALTFYRQDGILADDHNEPLKNQLDYIGEEGLAECESSDEDTIYISNELENMMYEVVIEKNQAFQRDFL